MALLVSYNSLLLLFARGSELTKLVSFFAFRPVLWTPPVTAVMARPVSRCGRSFHSASRQLSRRWWSSLRASQASSCSVSRTKWCYSKQAPSRSVTNCIFFVLTWLDAFWSQASQILWKQKPLEITRVWAKTWFIQYAFFYNCLLAFLFSMKISITKWNNPGGTVSGEAY